LCMAGGVALNCVANGRVLREGPFEDIWIQPAAGDAGGAIGIALAIWHRYLGNERVSPEKTGSWRSPRDQSSNGLPPYADGMKGSFLGPRNSVEEIEGFLKSKSLPYKKYARAQLPEVVAGILADEKIVGLHQGRMEFGPRALGARSIIGDARSPAMQSVMNLKIKYRESFRPFAPSVLRENVADWFELDYDSPYMMLVADVVEGRRREMSDEEKGLFGISKLNIKRSEIPAVTHVDYSARIQTVRRETNPLYWEIIEAFRQKTGCPVIVNTSFNVRGEPIVCTPEDSYRCFMRTEMDYLVLETCVLDKREQPKLKEKADWRAEFKLD
ncbi:MAG TPA: carbamoyltransferase C-terminal domain-containing protein, partial [Pyrinomonadaceae bacterium]|nr:carbamoyltransferase C-terminal domain-containing protein [Pyrinomonadaceae bacterium]